MRSGVTAIKKVKFKRQDTHGVRVWVGVGVCFGVLLDANNPDGIRVAGKSVQTICFSGKTSL